MKLIERQKWEATSKEIAEVYSNALNGVNRINEVIAHGEKDQEDKDAINSSVNHLEIITGYKDKDDNSFWTNEDFTIIEKAIVDGKEYTK